MFPHALAHQHPSLGQLPNTPVSGPSGKTEQPARSPGRRPSHLPANRKSRSPSAHGLSDLSLPPRRSLLRQFSGLECGRLCRASWGARVRTGRPCRRCPQCSVVKAWSRRPRPVGWDDPSSRRKQKSRTAAMVSAALGPERPRAQVSQPQLAASRPQPSWAGAAGPRRVTLSGTQSCGATPVGPLFSDLHSFSAGAPAPGPPSAALGE